MLKIETDIKRKEENKMKKWLSVLLAAVMLLAMAGIAGAETPKEATGTIDFQGLQPGESVVAYQIIEYTYQNGQYTDADWVSAIKNDERFANVKVDDVKGTLPEGMSESRFYEEVRLLVKDGTSYTGSKDKKIEGLKAGSYLCLISGGTTVHQLHIVSLNPVQDQNDEWTLRVNETGKQPTATEKASRPVLDKTMKVEGKETKQDQDTVAIGDTVTFDIYATVPEYPDEATKKTYIITDTMAQGLTLNPNSITVSLIKENKKLDAKDYTLTIHKPEADHGFTIEFKYDSIKSEAASEVSPWNSEAGTGYEGRVDTTKENNSLTKGVHIQYTATVNSNVKLESDDNKNHAQLVYSNNPYGESTSEINDEVKLYTYGLKVEKKDGKTKAMLEGAEFEIHKINGNEKATLSFKQVADGQYVVAKAGDKETVTTVAVSKKNENDSEDKKVGMLEIKGLDVGSYELVETKAPQDYNKLTQPEPFTITQDGKTHKYIDNTTSAYNNKEILNYKGIIMPSTGGMGTTIFMVAGIGVMACAVAALMLVLKRQKKNEG